jgi:hypothetical protein
MWQTNESGKITDSCWFPCSSPHKFLCLYVGVKIVFKVALVILKFSLGRPGVLKKCPTMYETLEVLRNPPQAVMDEEFVVHQVKAHNIKWKFCILKCAWMLHNISFSSCGNVKLIK